MAQQAEQDGAPGAADSLSRRPWRAYFEASLGFRNHWYPALFSRQLAEGSLGQNRGPDILNGIGQRQKEGDLFHPFRQRRHGVGDPAEDHKDPPYQEHHRIGFLKVDDQAAKGDAQPIDRRQNQEQDKEQQGHVTPDHLDLKK